MGEYIGSPDAIKENSYGIFEVEGHPVEISIYLNDTLDLKEFQDYVFITNQSIRDPEFRYPKMIHFVSERGFERFVQSGVNSANRAGVSIVRKWTIPSLNESQYDLWADKSSEGYSKQKREENKKYKEFIEQRGEDIDTILPEDKELKRRTEFYNKKVPLQQTKLPKLCSQGSGWHKEPISHSYAIKFGKAPKHVRGR